MGTISRCHVFMQLAGWGEGKQTVPPPFAWTEQGQISKITELNDEGPRWLYDDAAQTIALREEQAEGSGGELWTRAALGGAVRVEALRSLFVYLKAKGAVLTIVTKGYVGAVRKLLLLEGLLQYFD